MEEVEKIFLTRALKKLKDAHLDVKRSNCSDQEIVKIKSEIERVISKLTKEVSKA